jgi:hypothetical protein
VKLQIIMLFGAFSVLSRQFPKDKLNYRKLGRQDGVQSFRIIKLLDNGLVLEANMMLY